MSECAEIPFIFDTDALAQIFIAGQQGTLRTLRDDFAVHSYLMSEVEVELLSNRRIAGLVKPRYEKALKSGWVRVLAASDLDRLASSLAREVTLLDIRTLAAELKLYIQNGEAHTHAAALLLGCPSVSNDYSALKVLEANGKQLPPTVLRSFDIFGFCYQEGILGGDEAEEVRTALHSYAEAIPKCMLHKSFADGFPALGCRLSTSLAATQSGTGWASTFYLQRKLSAAPAPEREHL